MTIPAPISLQPILQMDEGELQQRSTTVYLNTLEYIPEDVNMGRGGGKQLRVPIKFWLRNSNTDKRHLKYFILHVEK